MSASTGHILLVWDRAGDYHRSRYEALIAENQLAEVHLADLGAADGLYKWHSETGNKFFHILSSLPVEKRDWMVRFKAFKKILKLHQIQIVGLAGYGRIEYILFILYSWFTGRKVILFAESWYGNSSLKNAFKGFFLGLTCHGFLVSGKRAKHHFEFLLGLPSEKIRTGYSVVDNDHFSGISDVEKEKILLCVARFAPEKNLENLIEAFTQSALIKKGWTLLLVGGGPLKARLLTLAENQSQIKILDWLSYEALPLVYGQASCFVLPSRFEPWGLVVNEAMAAGLPVIVSKACGCGPDLVDEQNGFVFDEQVTPQLSEILNLLANTNEEILKKMGKNSQQKIAAYSPKNWARAFMDLAWS